MFRNATSAEAFEHLEEARADVASFESGLWWGVTGLLVSAALGIAGAIVFGCIGVLASLIFGIAWAVTAFSGDDDPYGKRSEAHRRYSAALRRDSEAATESTP